MSFEIDGLDKLQDGIKKAVQKGVDNINENLDRINNPDAEKKADMPTNCPNCSATLDVSPDAKTVKCLYCGTTFDNTKPKTVVDSVFEFVEKQQQVTKENKERELEIEREELRIKAERAKTKAKSRFFSTIFKLIILGAFIYLCYMNWDKVNMLFNTGLDKLQAFVDSL